MEIVVCNTGIRHCVCLDCKRGVVEVREHHQSINRVMMNLDERSRRLFAGLLARQIRRGGVTRVHQITGLSRVTIRRGRNECESGQDLEDNRIRRSGGGRIASEKKILELLQRSTSY